jgi:hypothetical protein
VPFLRFSRDKRGVENFYLVQPTTNRRGKVRPRVLYWFRSPPDVRVGREPFDPAVRRALESQNPGITFDWRSIVETPIPSADADKWRERRRAERAAKHAAAAEGEMAAAVNGDAEGTSETALAVEPTPSESDAVLTPNAVPAINGAPRAGNGNRKRRRRRRNGGNAGGGNPSAAAPSPSPSSGDDSSGD